MCVETIHRACCDHTSRNGFRLGSWEKPSRQCRCHRPSGCQEHAKRSALGVHRPISDRSARVSARHGPGCWENDLVIAKTNRAMAILVEEASRHILVVPLPYGDNAPSAAEAV